MQSCDIVSQLTPPYTLQHNGVSERRNRTLLEMVRSMMNSTTLLNSLWGYALESAARILNMVWGCESLMKRDTLDKLEPRSCKCIFVGYPKETMGYYFYNPYKNKIFIARYAEFFKNSLTLQEASRSHTLHEASESDVEPHSEKVPIRRSERISQAPNRYGFYVDAEEHELGDLNEPPNYKATLPDHESHKWLDAMNAEM
ncbi:retrotransposon protein, putative, ty1-copia subclass [Tanacetum coccineum]